MKRKEREKFGKVSNPSPSCIKPCELEDFSPNLPEQDSLVEQSTRPCVPGLLLGILAVCGFPGLLVPLELQVGIRGSKAAFLGHGSGVRSSCSLASWGIGVSLPAGAAAGTSSASILAPGVRSSDGKLSEAAGRRALCVSSPPWCLKESGQGTPMALAFFLHPFSETQETNGMK